MSNIWKLRLFNFLSLPLKRVEILKFLLDLKTLEEGAVFKKEPCKSQFMPRIWKARLDLGIKSKGQRRERTRFEM